MFLRTSIWLHEMQILQPHWKILMRNTQKFASEAEIDKQIKHFFNIKTTSASNLHLGSSKPAFLTTCRKTFEKSLEKIA